MPVAEPAISDAANDSIVSSTTSVLVVDADPLVGQIVRSALPAAEFAVQIVRSAAQALDMWQRQRPSVVVLDQVLPDSDGLSVLAQLRELDSTLPVIFITAHGSSEYAIEAMKQGAFDYLSKPLDLGVLKGQVQLAGEARRLMRVPVVKSPKNDGCDAGDPFIGFDPAMAEVFKGIGRAAARDMSVLLIGERGTGKALVARAIYQNSMRSAAPFRVIRCSDFDPQELEAELFGAEGSNSVVGRIEQCSGGTLLLEEIGQTSMHLQSRLMRLLTSGQFEPLRGENTKQANVRILASSSQDLEELVAAGSFHADLYYYLRSLSLHLPSLRERPGDIPALVDYFVKRFSRLSPTLNCPSVRVSDEALQLLVRYSWPGNLDQLQSVLRQALIENMGTVLRSTRLQNVLQPSDHGKLEPGRHVTNWETFVCERLKASTSSLYAESVAEMERNLLAIVLESAENNQAKTARMLGITRGNLRKKLRTLGLAPPALGNDGVDPCSEEDDA